jgi:ABC-type sugar transport system permease subunit
VSSSRTVEAEEARLAWFLMAPAVILVALVTCFPLAWTAWESLHLDDLRLPWLGRPLIGLANYIEAIADPRFRGAVVHTSLFAAASVFLELGLGFALAMAMHRAGRMRGVLRPMILLPWALPSAVGALIWRFLFEQTGGTWFVHPVMAWVPVVTADVWKTAPFVALLLLAGLQNIDDTLYEAARMDGAGWREELWEITLPLLKPALLVALAFRALDALRVFDLIYVLTGGGPGTATESVSLYTFSALLQKLRFGYASALSVMVFLTTFVVGLLYIRFAGSALVGGER